VEPLGRALQDLSAWVTGMRREQSPTRDGVEQVETDAAHGGMDKYNPLALWSTQQVWEYVGQQAIPYNRLYDRGFRQIGCAPCTTPVRPDEDDRAGRWRWEGAHGKECGLHSHGSGI